MPIPPNRDTGYQEKLCFHLEDIVHSNPTATIWFAGDLYLPDIDWSSESITGHHYPKCINELMLNTACDLGLEQIFHFDTRDNNTLDVFMTNKPTDVVSNHHAVVFVDTDVVAPKHKNARRRIYLWHKGDITGLQIDMHKFTADFVRHYTVETSIDELWLSLKNTLHNAMDKFIRSKMTTIRFNQPLITRELKRLARRKKRKYRRATKCSSPEAGAVFRLLQKEMQKKCRIAYHTLTR